MLKWAPLLLVGASGGYATQMLWTTGGSGTPQQSLPDVVPTRAQQLARLKEGTLDKPFDILIIGGGATGTGCAVDAVSRGLRTALIEREDFASGTSSKSTKLVHGGVRYLEKAVFNLDRGQLKLVYEALHERQVLLQNASHLSQPLPILTPCYKWWEVPYYWAGMKAYDLVAGSTNLVLSKYIGPTEALNRLPTLATSMEGRRLKGGILYFDGQFDDARLNVTLACSAAAGGAAVLNYMPCRSLIKNSDGKIVGVQCQDASTGEQMDVYARQVINATGPWCDTVRRLSDRDAPTTVNASSGAHVTLPGYYGSADTGIIIPKTKDGRVVFVLPFQGYVIAGTTDAGCEVTDRPQSSEAEVQFILDTVGDYLGVRVPRSDVQSTWSGLRPLPCNPKAKAKDTASVVRDHVIFMDDDGLLNVTGGKWTTYRRMAEEAVDAAVASGRLPLNTKPCATHKLALLGAAGFRPTLAVELAQQHGRGSGAKLRLGTAAAWHLAHAYGDQAAKVVALAETSGLTQPLVEGHPYLEAEVLYCVRHEYCERVADFLARRTRLAFLDVAACQDAVPRVAELMAGELGWSAQRKQAEVQEACKFLKEGFHAAAPLTGAAQGQPAASP
ncbi:mitochondrial glycerol-3-phosphate dehydrogenase [Haematococcus lacustris]